LPPEQTSPASQAVPQAPQFFGSMVTSTQALPHLVLPPAQLRPHTPAEQTSPAAQTVPQVPQFFGSKSVMVQTPLQRVEPGHIVPVPVLLVLLEVVVELVELVVE